MSTCKTIYLRVPADPVADTPVHCTSCGEYLGRWADLERNFAKRGGYSGNFRLDEGKFTRID
jgi:hypothetical protein